MPDGGGTTPAPLRAIQVVHTGVWAFFASAVIGIPVCAATGRLQAAWVLIGVVFLEVVVLLVNRMKCPLTGLAERYTDDRSGNFDIFLPEWLGRNNQRIFGTLYVAGIVFTAVRWATG